MNRRSRRHGDVDPIAEAQEEANWSGFTRHIRGTSQGKWLFPNRRGRLSDPRTPSATVFLAVAFCALGLGAAIVVLVWILRLL